MQQPKNYGAYRAIPRVINPPATTTLAEMATIAVTLLSDGQTEYQFIGTKTGHLADGEEAAIWIQGQLRDYTVFLNHLLKDVPATAELRLLRRYVSYGDSSGRVDTEPFVGRNPRTLIIVTLRATITRRPLSAAR